MSKLKKILSQEVSEIILGVFILILLFTTMFFYMILC